MSEILEDYRLPVILKNNIDDKLYEHKNKYRNIYIRLITRCKQMTSEELSGYNEKHHILPKCMGGGNNKENLIKLPIRYHIMAHIILVEAYPENYKLRYSMNMMLFSNKPKINEVVRAHFSTRTIARERELCIINKKGENHPVYGKYRTEEEKELTREKFRGSKNARSREVISPDGKIYGSIVEASIGSNIPYDTLAKWLSGEIKDNRGWIYRKGSKLDFSNRSSEKSSKKIINSLDGVIYNSIKEACIINNIAYTTMRYWLSGRVKNNHGWTYYTETNAQLD